MGVGFVRSSYPRGSRVSRSPTVSTPRDARTTAVFGPTRGNAVTGSSLTEEETGGVYLYSMSVIVTTRVPRGTLMVTSSSTSLPRRARPIGDSMEMIPCLMSASREPSSL